MKFEDGRMNYLDMVSKFSLISHSVASENLRVFVKSQQVRELYSPEPFPTTVDIHPLIEADTGKLVTEIG